MTIVTTNSNNVIIIDNEEITLSFYLKKNFIICDNSNSITVVKDNYNFSIGIFQTLLERLLFSWEHYFFQKIKFKGKGYRIRKKGKMIKFFFYFSHLNVIKIFGCKLKKIGKYKFILLATDYEFLKKTALKVANIRNTNLFTKRGLRLAKQTIHKRQGKKNAYVK